MHGPGMLREGPAVDRGTGIQTDLGGFNFEPHPFAHLGQRAGGEPGGRVVGSPRNDVLTPVGPMLPGPVVELQHDLFGGICRIEIHIREQLVPFANLQGTGCASEKMLAEIGRRACTGLFTAEDGEIGLVHELPFGVPLQLGPGGRIVIEPDEFLGVEAGCRGVGRFGVFHLGQFVRDLLLSLGNLLVELHELRFLLFGRSLDDGRRRQGIAIHRGIGHAVVEREELIELLLRDRIKLVIVAHGTAQRHP